jgi:hypothetical protein
MTPDATIGESRGKRVGPNSKRRQAVGSQADRAVGILQDSADEPRDGGVEVTGMDRPGARPTAPGTPAHCCRPTRSAVGIGCQTKR